jgi:hypothetical protein
MIISPCDEFYLRGLIEFMIQKNYSKKNMFIRIFTKPLAVKYQSMKYLLLLHILSCFFVSCNNTESQNKQLNLQTQKTISIHLDTLASVVFSRVQYKDGKIIILNNKQNALDFYIFKNGEKLQKRIFLEREGENSVGIINDFLVHTSDSIFVLNCYQYKLFLINDKGKIVRKYNLIQGKINEETAMPDPFPFHPIVMINKKMYIASNPDRNPMQKSYFNVHRSLIELDIESGIFTYKYHFPEIYRKNIYPNALHLVSRTYSTYHKKFVYSFFADSCIRVTDIGHTKEQAFLANSIYLIKTEALKKPVFDEGENNAIANKSSVFAFIFYNPQKNEFYRYFSVKKEKQKEKGGVIILDTEFNKKAEVLLPVDKYNILSTIFTPEGMWIQRFTDNEDELVYDLVEFVAE